MANMSYCRFENTYKDLLDCSNNINEQLSDREHDYRQRLVEICQIIVEDYNPTCQDIDEGEWEDDIPNTNYGVDGM